MNSAQRLSRRTFVFHGLAATAGMTLLAACGQPAPSAPAAQPTSGSAAANAPTQPAAAAANAPGAAPKPTTPPTPGPQQLAPAQAGGVSLVVWKFGGSNEELSYFPKWNAEFTKRTGIGLDYSNNDWSTKREKILAAFQAKSLPDVLLMDGQSIPDLAKLGVIQAYEDLDKSLMAKWQPSFIPEIWNSTVNDGKFYGPSPYVDMGTFLAYNKQMFQDAGISRAPETWDDVRDAAKKLTTSDRAGIALGWTTQTNDANTVEGIAYANGGRWLDDTGKKVMINDAGFVDTLQMFVDIVKDGSVPQGITET
ncbi:MAG: extracellular solute-binding protein, partial [Chloroflexi bacterium]|nr:extracellular solute-binding protein [Chloroflexota bacterium]